MDMVAETVVGESLGALLRRYRVSRKLTQEQLAERTGMSVRAIRNLEIGRTHSPHPRSVQRLRSALGLNEFSDEAFARWGPCELPIAVPTLVGRVPVVTECARRLRARFPLVLVSGGPGVGKTATLVRVAHDVRDHFPDGQLYVDLDCVTSLFDLLGRLLRSLGVDTVPATTEERAAGVRAVLARRRTLLVLDNATGEEQIRPLLAAGSGSAVLVASRFRLLALLEHQVVELRPLADQDAVAMLAGHVGGRVAADPRAARSVVQLCSGLPLAVRIAAAWLVARPHRDLDDLAGLLADSSRWLDALEVGDLSMRRSLRDHLRRLPDEVRSILAQGVSNSLDLMQDYHLNVPIMGAAMMDAVEA